MIHFWHRWKWFFNKNTTNQSIAQLNLKVYADRLEFNMTGDEIKIGGALITLMLRHQHTHAIINNAVVATNNEIARRNADIAYTNLITSFNPN